jgi:integrase/recombinase XerD
MQKNVVFWWDELLQVCGWHGTTFRVGKRSPVQGETERSVKNMEERLRSEKWKRYEEFLVEGEKSPATVRKYIHDIQTFYLWLEEKELSKETLKEYKSWLSEHYKISSANSMVISLNLYLKFCGHAECCLKTFKIQKKMFLEKDLELSKEEYFRLLRAAGLT